MKYLFPGTYMNFLTWEPVSSLELRPYCHLISGKIAAKCLSMYAVCSCSYQKKKIASNLWSREAYIKNSAEWLTQNVPKNRQWSVQIKPLQSRLLSRKKTNKKDIYCWIKVHASLPIIIFARKERIILGLRL